VPKPIAGLSDKTIKPPIIATWRGANTVSATLRDATPTRRAASDFYIGRPKPRRFSDRICVDADMIDAVRPPNVLARRGSRLARSLLSFDKASPPIEGARRFYEF
jgi:hypothetical protein